MKKSISTFSLYMPVMSRQWSEILLSHLLNLIICKAINYQLLKNQERSTTFIVCHMWQLLNLKWGWNCFYRRQVTCEYLLWLFLLQGMSPLVCSPSSVLILLINIRGDVTWQKQTHQSFLVWVLLCCEKWSS